MFSGEEWNACPYIEEARCLKVNQGRSLAELRVGGGSQLINDMVSSWGIKTRYNKLIYECKNGWPQSLKHWSLRFLKILNIMGEWLILVIWKVLVWNHGSKTSYSVWCSSFPQSHQAKWTVPVITLLLPPLMSSPAARWLSCHLMLQKWGVGSFMRTRFQKMCIVNTEHVHWAALITCDMCI